jgi:hypothetical protein
MPTPSSSTALKLVKKTQFVTLVLGTEEDDQLHFFDDNDLGAQLLEAPSGFGWRPGYYVLEIGEAQILPVMPSEETEQLHDGLFRKTNHGTGNSLSETGGVSS